MNFEIDDIFETKDGKLWRVSGVIHDDRLVYSYNENIEEEEFSFNEVVQRWVKPTVPDLKRVECKGVGDDDGFFEFKPVR